MKIKVIIDYFVSNGNILFQLALRLLMGGTVALEF